MTTVLPPPPLAPAVPATTAAARPLPPADVPRRVGKRTAEENRTVLGSAATSLAVVWICYERILPFAGVLGFMICWYAAFLCFYAGLTAMTQPGPIVRDRVAQSVVVAGACVVALALATNIVYTLANGWRPLVHLNTYFSDMRGVNPDTPLTKGGFAHAILGTAIELAIATVVSVPLGMTAAVFMSEVGGRFAKVVRTVVEAMTALPDLVAGLFIYVTLLIYLGFDHNGLAAGLALAITMLPIIARSAEVSLRVVPGGLREAAVALGSTRWRMVRQVVLPTAAPGLATALILAFARGVGETAPVLLVSGETQFFNANPVKNPMNSLPLYTYQLATTDYPTYLQRAYGSAAMLLLTVLAVFVVVRRIARRAQKGTR